MRHFIDNNTLFIRGSFRVAGPGTSDGVVNTSTLIARTLPRSSAPSALREVEISAAAAGIGRDYRALVNVGSVQNICVLQYDFLTVFILAGLSPGKRHTPDAADISIIICSRKTMSDAALLKSLRTAGEIKAEALAALALKGSGSPADGIMVASECETGEAGNGAPAGFGSRIRAALSKGIPESVRKSSKRKKGGVSFFIFSRFRGEHWVEWTPKDCPYYPCHFPGQQCDFCYCPLYPCGDENLGEWATGSNSGRVWNCARCRMVHEPAVSRYLKRHPEASKDELVRIWKATTG